MGKRRVVLAGSSLVLAALVPLVLSGCGRCRESHHHRHHAAAPNRDVRGPEDVEAYIRHLESPERDVWQRPDEVIAALQLRTDAWIADVGSGPGYFTLRLAQAAPEGVVFAVDVEPRQLDRLNEHLRLRGVRNVVPVLAPADNPRLPPKLFDLVLVVNTYHHFPDRVRYFEHLREALRPGGRVVVIDYHKRELPVGPPPDHKLERDVVVHEALQAGLVLTDAPDFLPYQYFLVFRPVPPR
ncbi:MAG: class I SAM-dependent methyltransferase [Candidatus Binatia bacterium]|nr:class I SAM-dependent methyltransferase [Candidatus Binatia bacterium]